MYNFLLKKLVAEFRNGDMTAFSLIYDNFKKLIYFYSGKIGDDETTQELTVFLLELLYEVDISRFKSDKSVGLGKYISVCIRNKYIKLSKQNCIYKAKTDELLENGISSNEYGQSLLEISEALETLTYKQRMIVIYKYIYNLSDFEIAEALNISRQAVNRLKNRALNELRYYYE